ncbi:ROK family transcriptional regulator [Sphingomonadaceae bacterium jetA1]|jgi:predicted NBD/HSP70 family sugar kinase|uniref:ROK family transcriptional regulator n=1 Tax=Facivitalis istanbulensis TaxID=3075838 RepID=UPI00346A73E7
MTQDKTGWHAGHLAVLHALNIAKHASRAEIAQTTGLSPQSMTRIGQELIASGHIVEVRRRHTGGMGQPAIELGLVPGRILSLGLVLEHDRITCVLSDLVDGVIRRIEQEGDFLLAARSADASEALVAEALRHIPIDATLLGLGVSQSGFFFDKTARRVVRRGDIEGWMQLDLDVRLSERFGLDVIVENDGRAAAAGHLVHGVGSEYGSFFVVLMTRGVGGGAVIDRQLLRGRMGNAGEFAMLLPRSGNVRPSTESLADCLGLSVDSELAEAAIRSRAPGMNAWLNENAAYLERALLSVCALIDPEAIVFAGRLPLSIRAALAERIRLSGVSIGNISAPLPPIIVDTAADCLEIGAASLPVARLFAGLGRRR